VSPLPELLELIDAGDELARACRQQYEVTGDEACLYALEAWDKLRAECETN